MIFLLLALVICVGADAWGFWWAWRLRQRGGDDGLWAVVGGLSGIGLVCILLLVGVSTLPGTSVPDGCYRIATTSSVGVVSTGKGVTPVIMSGRSYTPIPCP